MSNIITLWSSTYWSSSTGQNMGHATSTMALATQFRVSEAGCLLSQVDVGMGGVGTPTDNVVVKIYADSGASVGSLLATSDERAVAVSATNELTSFVFSGDQQITLLPETDYWVAIARTGAVDAGYYRIFAHSNANQMAGDELQYSSDTTLWTTASVTSFIPVTIFGTHDTKRNILHVYPDAFYTDWANAFFPGYPAQGQHFTTPATPLVAGAEYITVTSVIWGHGETGLWSGAAGAGDYRVEIHVYGSPIDYAEVSTTRVGSPSDYIDRDLPYTKSDALNFHQTFRRITWSSGAPQLDYNTAYYIVFVAKDTQTGNIRFSQNDDSLDGAHDDDYFMTDGTAVATGSGEIWTAFAMIGEEELVIYTYENDITLLWTLLAQPSRDTILDWHLTNSTYLDSVLLWQLMLSHDYVLKIGHGSFADTILDWHLTTKVDQDVILMWKLFLSNDYVINWPLLHLVSNIIYINWGIELSADTILDLPLAGLITEIKILLWNLDNQIFRDYVIKYNIPVTKDYVIKYSLLDAITRVVTLVNDLENQVYRDYGIKYSIQIEKDYVLLVPLATPVNNDVVLRNDLVTNVDRTHIIKYDLLDYNPVQTDIMLRYAILGKPRFYKITFS